MHFSFEIKVTFCFEIQKKKQYEYCDYHIRRFLTSSFKWVKPRASEVVSIVSLQVDHFLALVCTLHFI